MNDKMEGVESDDDMTRVRDEPDEYEFTHPYRGIAVIINNERFDNIEEARHGTTVDGSRLYEVFSKLGFEVIVYTNLTCSQMVNCLKKAGQSEKNEKSDCFACAIFTHGDEIEEDDLAHDDVIRREDVLFGTDGTIKTADLLKIVKNERCPSLKGKPKLFFIQACRGRGLDDGIMVPMYAGDSGMDVTDAASAPIITTPAPCFDDFLVMYATPPGFFAFRNKMRGSWFAQDLHRHLTAIGDQTSLLKVLTRVNQAVSQRQSSSRFQAQNDKKQIACILSMLRKDIYFRETFYD